MTDRRAWMVIGVLAAAALVPAFTVRIERFWGDAATYHAMAWSLAQDGDIRYEAKDIFRVRREFPSGPEGLFLKRAAGGLTPDDASGFPFLRRVTPEEGRLYYAKPFLYPIVAAPFVRVFGTPGLLVVNALAFGLALAAGYAACRRDRSPGASLAIVSAIALGTVTPLYLVWLAPEMLYFGVVAAALAAWRLDRPLLGAVLLGIATYAKPPNVFLAIPIVASPLVAPGLSWPRRLTETVVRGLVFSAAILAFFGWNVAFTGEWNYQAGERKTFSRVFPFEVQDAGKETSRKVTFGNSGFWMTTPTLGPQADGDEAPPPTPRTEPPRPASELRASFLRNLYYFWIGRFGGAVPYFLPVVVAMVSFLIGTLRHASGRVAAVAMAVGTAGAAAFLPESWYGGGQPVVNLLLLAAYVLPALAAAAVWSLRGPRDPHAALTWVALWSTFVFYIWFIPDDWYGNGNLGNRYFLTLVPLAFFFVAKGREAVLAASALLGAALLLRPLFVSPVYYSSRPAAVHTTTGMYRSFPAELTMLNDLAIFMETWRKKQAYGDVGDDHKHWPAEPTAYYLYFPDDGTHGRESRDGLDGFWVRGGTEAEIILRAFDLKPILKLHVEVTGGPAGDEVDVAYDGRRERLTLAAGEARRVTFEAGPGFAYKETFLHTLRFRSSRGAPDGTGRSRGCFVRIELEVDKKAPRL